MFNITIHHIILRLNDGQWVQAVFFNNGLGFFDTGTAPFFTDTVVENLTLIYQSTQCPQCLFHRSGRIKTVTIKSMPMTRYL